MNPRQAYERWHEPLAVRDEPRAPWHQLLRQHLDPDRDIRGKCVLEIGCGRGELACWLASHGKPARVVAADFAATAVAKGRESAAGRGLNTIDWEVMDIQAIAHAASSFDTVISCETVEHVVSPRLAIRELARVLKPGGKLLLTTPNYLGTLGLYRIYLRMRGRTYTETGQPINHCMLLPATRHMVSRAGLSVVTVDAIGHYLPFPGRPPIEFPRFNRPRRIMCWLGLHSLVVAEKRRATRVSAR